MRWIDLPIIAFDTETTGLDPFAGDRVIEVAMVCLRVSEQGEVLHREDFVQLVNPGIAIPKKVTEITGLTDDHVAGAPPFAAVAEELASRFRGAIAVAHNLPFDHAFLTEEFRIAGVPWVEPLISIDTVDLSMKLDPEARSHKLSDVAARLDVRLVDAHRAVNDALACGLSLLGFARRQSAPAELGEFVRWAGGIGPPPEGGPVGLNTQGVPVFLEGEAAGEPVSAHPLQLAWLQKARVRAASGWDWRYPEPVRDWAQRWLTVRAAGRAGQQPKSVRPADWVIDPCIADDRGLLGDAGR
jgi:DNA polymerase III epsilon subunit-like protein